MLARLYGDGIHDDYKAIQQRLDTRTSEVFLPAPKACYCISKTLKIHGGQTLRLPRTAVIKLMKDSNCAMIEDDDFSVWKENICIDGGIWDYNNMEQEPNPYHFAGADGLTYYQRLPKIATPEQLKENRTGFWNLYTGFCMRFCRVKNLTVKNLTLKNPVCYGVEIGFVKDFVFNEITFDYALGNPKYWNMDGIHVEGGCDNGDIRNLHGACHDDLVAITANDLLHGPINNIVVDGIYAEHCHSAVRLLSLGDVVNNIVIKNVFGSYYTYCISLTKYHHETSEHGKMNNIFIENVCACASEGTKDVEGGHYPFIWVEHGLDVENLVINRVARHEKTYTTPTIKIDNDVNIDGLHVFDVLVKDHTDGTVPALVIEGNVQNEKIENVREVKVQASK